MEVVQLYELPVEILTALAGGYLGYRIFSSGLHKHLTTQDALFQTFFFSLPALLTFRTLGGAIAEHEWLLASCSIVAAMVVGVLGRIVFPHLTKLPKALGLSIENYWPNTWAALIYSPEYVMSRVEVRLKSGEWLESDLLQVPQGAPHYPVDLDADGNIALYVTRKTDVKGRSKSFDLNYEGRAYWGDAITFISKDEISRVRFCKSKKTPAPKLVQRPYYFWRMPYRF
jgi:hypothetical protein